MGVIVDVFTAFLSTLLFPVFISDLSLSFSNSAFSILFFVVLIVLFRYTRGKKYGRRMWILAHILGFLFAMMTACGYSLDATGTIRFKRIFISILLFSHVYATIISAVWGFLQEKESYLYSEFQNTIFCKISNAVEWIAKRPVIIFLLLLLCWLPAYIADFPGGFRYDATGELSQSVFGYNGNYPMLHSAIITYLLPWAYRFFGSYNAGVALYIAVQMFLMSAVYTHMLFIFYKQKINKILLLIVIAYCGLFPVIQILVVQEVRDVLFSILLVYTMFLFYLMETDKNNFMNSKVKPMLLGTCLTLTLLARNNNAGMAALIILILINLLLLLLNRKNNVRGGMVILTVSAVGSYIMLSLLLTALCQPMMPANTEGSLSIMSQTIVRAYIREADSWTGEEIEELKKYMDLNELNYCAENADWTKSRLKVDDQLGDFFIFWCKIGLKHVGCYVDAILANTQNMWFPASVIDGYKQVFREKGQPYYEFDKCYYGIRDRLEEPVIHRNLWPEVLNYYTQIGLYISFERIPIISMLFSIGFNLWVILNCLLYAVYKKNTKLYLPLAIILVYALVSACVPLVLLRYFAAIFLAMPMIIVFTIQPSVADMPVK